MLVIQAILCEVLFTRSDTLSTMENDAYDLFSEKVSSNAGYIENDMVLRWSDLSPIANEVRGTITNALAARNATAHDLATGSDLSLSLIDAVADDLVDYTGRAEVSGVYFVLADSAADAAANSAASPTTATTATTAAENAVRTPRTALYVRDSNPLVDSANSSDLLLAACPIGVAKRLGLAFDFAWSATFPLASEGAVESDFYYQPLRAAEQYPGASDDDLGYWGHAADLGWSGTNSLTYSMPVCDSAGVPLGVLGVEVSLDRVASFFPAHDFGTDDNGSFLLAVTEGEGTPVPGSTGGDALGDASRTYEVIISTGATQTLYVNDGQFDVTHSGSKFAQVSPAAGSATGNNAVASITEIGLYDATSPFANEHWALVGLESENKLFSASHVLARNMFIVFGGSLAAGLVVAFFASWAASTRMRRVMLEARTATPDQPIVFTPTGVVEVDELTDAVTALGQEVARAASRLSHIMALSDRTIGAYEYNEEAGTVAVTDDFFALVGVDAAFLAELGLDPELASQPQVSSENFHAILDALRPSTEQEAEGRSLLYVGSPPRWVRLVVVESEEHQRVFGLVEDVTDEITTRRRIEHERDHDVLTGLLNRRAFERRVELRFEAAPPAFAAMIMLDLDNLKFVNDTYGHDWGDAYIRGAGSVITDVFGRVGICSRISGDEFMVFVDQCGTDEEVSALFEEFGRKLNATILTVPDGRTLKVRASAGAAFYPEDANDYRRLREFADFAMYEAKNNRKGELCRFVRTRYDEESFMLSMREDLNRLLDENLVDYHFQPIVDAHTGCAMGFEALMRPQLATIPTPDRVLALARAQSKLYRVERMTFFESFKAFAQFPAMQGRALFVNSIATQRMSANDEAILRTRYASFIEQVVVEFTESDYNRDMALRKEKTVHQWGSRVAVDDYGSGANSEAVLLDFRADFVKIDIKIVRGIDESRDNRDIATALISYAHERDILVIAEGVETQAELEAVIELGADYIQGYLTGRPAPEPTEVDPDMQQLIRSISARCDS